MPHLNDLVETLVDAFSAPYTDERILEVLRENPVDPGCLERYFDFRDDKYTRNLAFKNDKFEVIILCWEKGQISRIHNHAGQSCWMCAPIGKLQVVNYRVAEGSGDGGFCRLERTDDIWLTPTEPGMVDAAQPIHSVGNPAHLDERAVSVHIYSDPYDHCMIYQLDDQLAQNVSLAYDNEQGLPLA